MALNWKHYLCYMLVWQATREDIQLARVARALAKSEMTWQRQVNNRSVYPIPGRKYVAMGYVQIYILTQNAFALCTTDFTCCFGCFLASFARFIDLIFRQGYIYTIIIFSARSWVGLGGGGGGLHWRRKRVTQWQQSTWNAHRWRVLHRRAQPMACLVLWNIGTFLSGHCLLRRSLKELNDPLLLPSWIGQVDDWDGFAKDLASQRKMRKCKN